MSTIKRFNLGLSSVKLTKCPFVQTGFHTYDLIVSRLVSMWCETAGKSNEANVLKAFNKFNAVKRSQKLKAQNKTINTNIINKLAKHTQSGGVTTPK